MENFRPPVPGNGHLEVFGRPFFFHGKGTTLFGIQLVNLLLIIITFGIYYFWGKVKVRKYIWSRIEFAEDRLCFHGTGQEILLGWIKAAIVFGVPFYFFKNFFFVIGASVYFQLAGVLMSWVVISLFIPFAIVGTRRYRASRTSLRGIRFSFRGKWWDFAKLFFRISSLLVLTLGLYYPYYSLRKTGYLTERTYFGNRKFGFDGKGSDLFGSFVIAALLALPSLFISMIWFSCKKTKYVFEHTTFAGARFHSAITFGEVLGLYAVNLLILIATLGFGSPFVKIRNLRYFTDNLSLKGELDLAAIAQDAETATATGEGVGDFLDMDFDLG